MTDDFASRKELNGLGVRVNSMEICAATHEEQIKNLDREFREQRRDTWKAIGELRDQGMQLIMKLSVIFGGIVVTGFALTIIVQIVMRWLGK